MKYNLFILATLVLFTITKSFSQEAVTPRPSPIAIVTMKYEDTYVKLTYCQPHKRDRGVFGGLVPYGQVWRTGANEATEITLTGDLQIKNDTLPAGTYAIFTIPQPDKWIIIFNKQVGQWGAYNYTDKADILRVEVPVQTLKNAVYEPFTITFEQKNDKAEMLMMWETTKVAIPIAILTD
jgi:hypothetical protein